MLLLKNVKLISVVLISIIVIIFSASACGNSNNEKQPNTKDSVNITTQTVKRPITDAWVYRYNVQTGQSDFAACGYIDQYTSLVTKTDETVSGAVTGTFMYLGSIKGYQNEDKTIEVYQVTLTEISENFILTNDSIELDYSGNKKMIEVDGWIYMDGNTIIAVSPVYAENELIE